MNLKDALGPALKEYESGGGGGGGDLAIVTTRSDSALSYSSSAYATKGTRYRALKAFKLLSVCIPTGGASPAVSHKCVVYLHGTDTNTITAKHVSINTVTFPIGLHVQGLWEFAEPIDIPDNMLFDVVLVAGTTTTAVCALSFPSTIPAYAEGHVSYVASIREAVLELNVGDSLPTFATNSHCTFGLTLGLPT